MAVNPTYVIPSTFMGVSRPNTFGNQHSIHTPLITVCGIPFDLGTSNRPGTRFGPAAIRAASRMLLDGDHPFHWVNPINQDIIDVGDLHLAQGDIPATIELIQKQAETHNHLISLGGDHTITLPLLRAVAKKHGAVGLIHLDAHVDTWPDGDRPSYYHGNPLWHAINEGLVDPARMIQIGIRSPVQKSVYDWTTEKGVYIWTAEEVHQMGTDIDLISEHIMSVMIDIPVYLTVDIDVLDPAFAPGTGTPEIGGLNSWQVQKILRQLVGLNFVGMDMVEVSPPYDISEITSLAAATFVWEYLALLKVEPEKDIL